MACATLVVSDLAMAHDEERPERDREPVAVQADRVTIPGRTGLERSPLSIEAAFTLRSSHPDFGGLSGVWLDDDGEQLIAVGDNGLLWQTRLIHDEGGRLLGTGDWFLSDIKQRPGDPKGQKAFDAEALANDGDRGLVVAYEGYHRLRRFPMADVSVIPDRLPRLTGLGKPSNSGIETLTGLAGGRFLAIAEGVGAWGGVGLSAWLIDGDRVDDLIYVQSPGFAPTGADRLDETLYILERQFSLLGGFKNKIMTLMADEVQPGALLEGRELASFQIGDIGENFEAIAARRAPDGGTLLYLISDDNFHFLQRTLLLQLSLSAVKASSTSLPSSGGRQALMSAATRKAPSTTH